MSAKTDKEEAIAVEVLRERDRQDAKWGEQNHPDGTGLHQYQAAAERAKRETDQKAQRGTLTWTEILREEFLEAIAESDPQLLRAELVQVSAVAQQWIGAIDRRTA